MNACLRAIAIALALVLVAGGLGQLVQADPPPPPPPKTGDATICFAGNNEKNEASKGGVVTITAKKPGKPDLSVRVPIPKFAQASAVPALAAALFPASWTSPADYVVAANCIMFKGVTEIDGDPGTTELKMTFTTSADISVTGRKVTGKKPTGSGGSSGRLEIIGAGMVQNAAGEIEVRSAGLHVILEPTETLAQLMARVAGLLVSDGWVVEYSAATPESLVIRKIPDDVALRSLIVTIEYRDTALIPYHWAFEFVE